MSVNREFSRIISTIIALAMSLVILAQRSHELPVVSITVAPDTLWWMNATASKEIEPIATFRYESEEDTLSQDVRLQIAGSGSRWGEFKSFELKAKKELGKKHIDNIFFDKETSRYKSLKLRTIATHIHDKYPHQTGIENNAIMTLFGRNSISGIDYQETKQVVLYINDEYNGLYDLTETTNAKYIKSTYGLEEDEINYVKLQAEGDTIVWKYNCEEDSVAFANMIEEAMSAETYEKIDSIFDMDNILDYFVCETYFENEDWINNNCIMWRKRDGGKWKFILNDFDLSIQNPHSSRLYNLTLDYDTVPPLLNSLFKKLCEIDSIKNRFNDRILIAYATYLKSSNIEHMVDSLADNIRPEMQQFANLYYSTCKERGYSENEQNTYYRFDESIDTLRNWWNDRLQYINNDIIDFVQNPYMIPLSINICDTFLFNDEIVREQFVGYYFAERLIDLKDKSGENIAIELVSKKPDGSVVKEYHKDKFMIGSDTKSADIYIYDLKSTVDETTKEETEGKQTFIYDITGRRSRDKSNSFLIKSNGEKKLTRKQHVF